MEYSMRVKYCGLERNIKKGTELVVTLELYHNTTNKLIWKEVLILFSSKKYSIIDVPAQILLKEYSNACDFTNLEEKEIVEEGHIKIIGDEIWRFSMLSGDVNPIHISNILALLFGQKGRIAHGAMVMGKALSLMDSIEAVHIPNKLGVSFKGPTPCGAVVTVKKSNKLQECNKDHCRFDLICNGNNRPSICVRSLQ